MMPNDTLPKDRIGEFSKALIGAWSLDSSSLWTAANPAAGHCGVTALVAHDLFGGDIRKTRYSDIWHFYNVIDGQRLDFTESQFGEHFEYSDVVSDREEAFGDTNAEQYAHLKKAVCEVMGVAFEAETKTGLSEI